jgi:hypothetical protein
MYRYMRYPTTRENTTIYQDVGGENQRNVVKEKCEKGTGEKKRKNIHEEGAN